MSHDPIFTQLNVFDAPEPPNLQPGLAERAVLFEVIRVTPSGRPLPAAPAPVPPPSPRPPSTQLTSPMLLAIVGLVSGSTGAVASAAGIALGLVLGAALPQLATPLSPELHDSTITSPPTLALSATERESTVASQVEVERLDHTARHAEPATVAAISVAEAMPHLSKAVTPAEPTKPARDTTDAIASLDETNEASEESTASVWGAPPPHFDSALPAPPPPLRLAAATPVTRAPAQVADDDGRVKLVDRLGLRKRH